MDLLSMSLTIFNTTIRFMNGYFWYKEKGARKSANRKTINRKKINSMVIWWGKTNFKQNLHQLYPYRKIYHSHNIQQKLLHIKRIMTQCVYIIIKKHIIWSCRNAMILRTFEIIQNLQGKLMLYWEARSNPIFLYAISWHIVHYGSPQYPTL